MNCPRCNGRTTVVCCRRNKETVSRQRKCKKCNYIFYSKEIITDDSMDLFYTLNNKYVRKLKNKKEMWL